MLCLVAVAYLMCISCLGIVAAYQLKMASEKYGAAKMVDGTEGGEFIINEGGKELSRVLWKYKLLSLLLTITCIGLILGIVIMATKISSNNSNNNNKPVACKSPFVQENNLASSDPNMFQDLTPTEMTAVHKFMLSQSSLNLTEYGKATLSDNFIHTIEYYLPEKTAVLEYIDKGGKKPERRARVIIIHGASTPPHTTEYIVSPLPKPKSFKILHLKHYKSAKIPFNGRPICSHDLQALDGIIKNATEEAYPLLKESFGYWVHNCTDKCIIWVPIGMPGRKEPGKRYSWVQFNKNIKGRYLFVIPFQVLLDYTYVGQFEILEVVYNNQKFSSVADLMLSYRNGSLKMIYLPESSKKARERATLHRRGTPQPSTPMRGPVMMEPNGKRFSVKKNLVSYMNWKFEFGIRPTAGLGLYNVRFDGKQVAYEISMQEGMAYYSGFDPETSNSHYLDSSWRLGIAGTLMRGIDCPENAVLLDSYHFHWTDMPVKSYRSICIFEINSGIPLWRHYDDYIPSSNAPGGMWFQGGMVDHALVIRVISTPGNYDYVFDYVLHQNGVIKVQTAATGYINPAVYTKEESMYGCLSTYDMIGTIHDHYMLYKVDLDIAGVKNSYQVVNAVPRNLSYEWEKDAYRIKKTIVKDTKKREKDAILRYNFDKPKYLVFMNENKTNVYGKPKGYRIVLQNKVKQLYPDAYYMNKVASWSKYQLSVTKYKDLERFGSNMYNQFMMQDPIFDFDDMINDNEAIENEDLVAWIPVGGLHIPNTEDIPVTNTVGSSYSFLIKPFGYFDEDPSLGSRNAVLTDRQDDGTFKKFNYGTPDGSSCPVPKRG